MRRFSSGLRPQRAVRAGHARHAVALHHADGGDLVAHQADGLGLGADEDEAAVLDAFGEIRVLGQEAVARMDGAGVGHFGRADDRGHVQVAQLRGRRPDADAFIGEQHMLEAVVGRGVHGDGLDAQFFAGAQDAQRYFAAVGDDEFFEHGLFDDEQGLAELNRIAVLRHDGGDLAALVGLDLVHHLHGLDDAQHLADLDLIADVDEGLGARRRRRIEGAHHGRRHHMFIGARLGALRPVRRWPRAQPAAPP